MLNIHFNNTSYNISEAALNAASERIKAHLSTVMNGSGATINLGGTSYSVDSTKLSAATNSFVSHLGTIAGGSGGSDTLTWDGNTDGLVCVGGAFYKISDATPTENDFANGFSVVVGGEVVEFSKEMVSEMVAMIGADVLSFGGGFVAYTDGASANDGGFIFPEAGIYFYYGDDSKMTSITIPNYTGFGGGSGLKVTIGGGETTVASDTLTWDGNTEGLLYFETKNNILYKVSDVIPTVDDVINGVYEKFSNASTASLYTTDDDKYPLSIETEAGIIMTSGVVIFSESAVGTEFDYEIVPEAGVYFTRYDDEEYVESLTIPGYTGF